MYLLVGGWLKNLINTTEGDVVLLTSLKTKLAGVINVHVI